MKLVYLILVALLLPLATVAQTNSYTVTPIVDNTQDPFLINPWGLSRAVKPTISENEWWVSDNVTGFTTLYYANKTGIQSLAPLIITIPTAIGTGTGSPTGTAYNGGIGPGPGLNNFTYVTLDGTISNWNAGQTPTNGGTGCTQCHVTTTTIMVNNNSKGAVYTGLAVSTNPTTQVVTYYAANNKGGVEAYDGTTFAPVTLTGRFGDPRIPSTYKPYGIQTIATKVWVTFFDGKSGGYVDAFDTTGRLRLRLATGQFSEPWGLVQAPPTFGAFAGMILVGNTTSGMIGAYDPVTGAFKGFLNDASGNPIVIPGLWGISFGNGNKDSGPTNTLYYSAGDEVQKTGVFGAITAN